MSTAEAGLGNTDGSKKTPLGAHKVSEKVGKDATLGRVFIGRKKTKKIAKILKKTKSKSKDEKITSRIFRLSGMEKGINNGRNVDTYSRLIYIHGTDEEGRLGKPASSGSIPMGNKAIIDLFDRIPVGTIVDIVR
ncbi:MAG: L,D-transpeptidase [Cocleimonas sp.]